MTVIDKYDFSAESVIKEPLFDEMSALDAQLRPNLPVREEISFASLSAEVLTKTQIASPMADSTEKQHKPREMGL